MAQLQATKRQVVRPDYVEVEPQFKPELLEPVQGTDIDHARALQQRLLHAYDPSAEEQKLPTPQRIAIILALTCALWAALGISVFLMLQVLS